MQQISPIKSINKRQTTCRSRVTCIGSLSLRIDITFSLINPETLKLDIHKIQGTKNVQVIHMNMHWNMAVKILIITYCRWNCQQNLHNNCIRLTHTFDSLLIVSIYSLITFRFELSKFGGVLFPPDFSVHRCEQIQTPLSGGVLISIMLLI